MIPLFKVYMRDGVGEAANSVLTSDFVGQGKVVDDFENLLNNKFGHKHAITVNSATSGLHLLYHIFRYDDCEVLTSPLTCTATNFPILHNRMKIKWVDVDSSCNMDLKDLERKISPTTKIIVLTHWGGNPIDLEEVHRIVVNCGYRYGFRPIIIQDCAHAIGSEFEGLPLSYYENSVYSFQAIKHFTTVDGGCIFVREERHYKRLKLLRWYGIDREGERKDFRCEDDVIEAGYKFHMNNLNAAIGIHNFPDIDKVVDKHIENSKYYDLNLPAGVRKIRALPNAKSSQWIHTIHVDNRDGFMRYMKENGVMTSRVHERNDKHSCMADFKAALPQLDEVVKTMVCIPNGWWVTSEDREMIVDLIKKGW